VGDRPEIFTAGERRRGYREALAAAGIKPEPRLERMRLTSSEAAASAALELLRAEDPPTAVFAAQNLITVGTVRALRELGRQHDVALVGFDDVVLGDLVEPGITVVRQDPYELGRQAAQLLFSQLAGRADGAQALVLPTQLVPRGSGEIPATGTAA